MKTMIVSVVVQRQRPSGRERSHFAIDAYDNALTTDVSARGNHLRCEPQRTCSVPVRTNGSSREIVNEPIGMVPDTSVRSMYEEASFNWLLVTQPSKSHRTYGDARGNSFVEHNIDTVLYQYALAAQDTPGATQLMPTYATSWIQGESEPWKPKVLSTMNEQSSSMRLLADSLVPVIERLRKRQELLTMPEPTGGRKIPALH
jgi:hypothetical protein